MRGNGRLAAAAPQYTLVTLVKELAQSAGAGETQEALLEWLYSITRSLGVRMRCVSAATPAPLALVSSWPPLSGNTAEKANIERIILSCNHRNIHGAPLCAKSNGTIIDARTWGHLVVPTRALALHPSAREVDRGLSAPSAEDYGTGVYDIIQARDGTVVNLYCWDHPAKGPMWCLSTSNGYDVSHLRWRGAKTHAELVHGLLLRHPAFVAETEMTLERNFLRKGDVRLGFGRLARTRCYTIGFRHGNFHPMEADPPAVWNIQSADLATGRPECGPGGGLPHVPHWALYTCNDIASRRGAAVRMADLDYISRTALEDAKAIIAGWPAAGRCHFNYGFILRARDRSYPDVGRTSMRTWSTTSWSSPSMPSCTC